MDFNASLTRVLSVGGVEQLTDEREEVARVGQCSQLLLYLTEHLHTMQRRVTDIVGLF